MLSERYPPEALKKALIPRDAWHPFPTADERKPWESLPETVRKAHVARGEKRLGAQWPSLPATLFMEFARNGNRTRYERESFGRRGMLCDLVIAECVEGKGRFVDDIVNGIWAICEESHWGIPACMSMQKAGPGLPDTAEPVMELFVGETVNLLAWVAYLLGPQLDAVSPLILRRIRSESGRRAFSPCLERDDFWWMGYTDHPRNRNRRVNNWNPWINSNWLASVLLLEQDPERRLSAVAKVLRSLDNFIDPYPKDGGCDEGPGYWGRAGASLFDCLELLHSATNGVVDVFSDPLIQEIGRFIYRVQIHDRYFINFADAPALVSPSASLVFRYGQRIGDSRMMSLGAWAAQQQDIRSNGVSDSIGRQLAALFSLSDLLSAEAAQPLLRDAWFPEIQVMAARDREGSEKGLYVAAKGGHNAESHNHNDIGNFIVYVNGRPVLIDAGVETYSAKTFGPDRYDIWTMQSAYHNLPTIGGVMQRAGREYAARNVTYRVDDEAAELSLDIAGGYPQEAGLKSWVRTVRLNRGKEVLVTDAYALAGPGKELAMNLLTPCQATLSAPGQVALQEAAGTVRVHYEAAKWQASVETLPIEDARLKGIWGDRLTRIVLRADAPPDRDTRTLRVVQGT